MDLYVREGDTYCEIRHPIGALYPPGETFIEADITELRKLPLVQLISAPLNAVIAVQASAAMTMVKFTEELGFKRSDEDSFFDDPESSVDNDYVVRVAKLRVDANGTRTNVDITFITLVNVPNFEISNFDWSFDVKLPARISNIECRQGPQPDFDRWWPLMSASL